MSWICHGHNKKQCCYEWHCFVCWLRTLLAIFRVAWRVRHEHYEGRSP